MDKYLKENEKGENLSVKNSPHYEPPTIITYDGDDIIEELGPVLTCSPAPDCPVDE